MYKPKLEKDIRCPIEYGIDMFGGKWKARMICVISTMQPVRYNTLRKELCDITDAVLSNGLKELQRDGLVDRVQYNEIPPKVEYSLTERGKSVLPILRAICAWSDNYTVPETELTPHVCQRCNYRGRT